MSGKKGRTLKEEDEKKGKIAGTGGPEGAATRFFSLEGKKEKPTETGRSCDRCWGNMSATLQRLHLSTFGTGLAMENKGISGTKQKRAKVPAATPPTGHRSVNGPTENVGRYFANRLATGGIPSALNGTDGGLRDGWVACQNISLMRLIGRRNE